ncbi:MAG TPA: radical SAM protein [Patescibacteria group bacterium]|nr:radical SAM protein [Patescibacteria group bacterium]
MTILKMWRALFNRQQLDTLIFFITDRCNSRCRSCFYWQNLNQHSDLSLDKINKMATSLPRFTSLLISGGEPSLRDDLPEIINAFSKHSSISFVSIPTNGLLTDKVVMLVKKICSTNTQLVVTISVSIDGFEKTSEDIRGIPGGWARSITTLKKLLALKKNFSNLRVAVNTLVCRETLDTLTEFSDYLIKNYSLDAHNLEIIRGDARDPSLKEFGPRELQKIFDLEKKIHLHYFKKNFKSPNTLRRIYHLAIYLLSLVVMKTQRRLLLKKQPWLFDCLAGRTIMVVDSRGYLKACELRPAAVDLFHYDYNITKAQNSEDFKAEIETIKKTPCPCTHGCFINSSVRHEPLGLIKTLLLR